LQLLQKLAATLSDKDQKLMSHSLFLGVISDELGSAGPRDYLIRNLIGVDQERGAIAIGEHLRLGQRVQFHLRDARTSAEDLQMMLQRFASTEHAKTACGALLFSCLGRGKSLYGVADHDSNMFQRLVGDIPIGGFFCNGEIGPVAESTHVHGYTSAFGIFRPAHDPIDQGSH